MRLLLGAGGEVYFTGDHYGDGPEQDAYFVLPAPEPGTVGVMGVGGVWMLVRRRGGGGK